jgi:septal ring factor EnvC (AmiA/AmiB activator)
MTRAMSQAQTPKLNLRKLESIQRLLRYGAILVLFVFLALIAYSWFQLQGINRQIDSKQAELEAKQRETDKADEALRRKQEELRKLDEKYKVLSEAMLDLSDDDDEQADKVEAAVEKAIGQGGDKSQIPPRIYIQIAREDQRRRAAQLTRQLQARGYVVPGIENVGRKARIPRVSELRYYSTGAAQSDIDDILSFLRSAGVNLARPVQVRQAAGVRPRHYELWFGEDF